MLGIKGQEEILVPFRTAVAQEYLADVMVRVNTHPQSRIAELTPHGWLAINKSEEKLSA